MGDSPDAVDSILRATMAAASEDDGLPEASRLELDSLLKSIVSSGFSEESMRQALQSGHPKIRGRVADFLFKVGQSRGTLKRGPEAEEGAQELREAMMSKVQVLRKAAAEKLIELVKQP